MQIDCRNPATIRISHDFLLAENFALVELCLERTKHQQIPKKYNCLMKVKIALSYTRFKGYIR